VSASSARSYLTPPTCRGLAVASFLAERDLAPSSHRVYVLALDRLVTCHASSQAGLLCAICVVWIYNDPAPLPG